MYPVIARYLMFAVKSQTPFACLLHFADQQPPMPDKFTFNHIFIFAFEMKFAPRPRKNLFDMFGPVFISPFAVQYPAVIIGNRGHIKRRLFTPLNLQRRYRHFQNIFLQSHVFHRKIMLFPGFAGKIRSAGI